MIVLIFFLGYQLVSAGILNVGMDAPTYDCTHCQPEQTHISFGDKPNDIVVMWSTFNDTGESQVKYGESVLDKEAIGRSAEFAYEGRVQYIHTATLKGLKYDTRYVYHCGSHYAWSKKFSFKTPREGNNFSFDAIIIGDMGVTNAHALPYLQKEVESKDYAFVLHVGDFAYDMYDDEGRRGDDFMRQIEPVAALVPYMTAPGNHEEHDNFTHYKIRFTMPSHQLQESMYYSWDLGPVHWVATNTEAYYFDQEYGMDPLLNSFRWLKEDLEEANKPENREKRPWVIVYGHRPMYCSNADDASDCSHEQTKFGNEECGKELDNCRMEPLLKQYGVDVVVWAHEHSFERTWPVYDGKVYNGSTEHPYVNPRAPIHVIQGSAGCSETIDPFVDNAAEWSAFRYSDYGYTRFTAHNHTHLYFEQISATENEKVIDSFWVIKEHHGTYEI